MIYLDNAATTLQKPQAVYDAVYETVHKALTTREIWEIPGGDFLVRHLERRE